MRELRLPGLGCAVVCAGGFIWPAVAGRPGGSRSVSEGFAWSDQDGLVFRAHPGTAGCPCCCPRQSRATRAASRPDRASPGSRIRAHPLRELLRSPAYPFRLRRPGAGPVTAGGFPQATQARSLIWSPTGSLLMDNLTRLPPHGIWVYALRKLRGLCVCGKRIKCSPEPSCLGPEFVRR